MAIAAVIAITVLLEARKSLGVTFLKGASCESELAGRQVIALELSSLSPEDFSVRRATPYLSTFLYNSTYLPGSTVPQWDRSQGVLRKLDEHPGESRDSFLARVDREASQLASLVDPQSVFLVTGRRPSWMEPRGKATTAAAANNLTETYILDPGALLYLRSATARGKDAAASSILNIVNASVEGEGLERVIRLDLESSGALVLYFVATSYDWRLSRAVRVSADGSEADLTSDSHVHAHRNTSFSCRRLALAGGSMVLRYFQVQPFDVSPDARFHPSYDCENLFCPAIMMGFVVLSVFLGCLFVAILAISSIRVPDRFEDPSPRKPLS